MQRLSCPLEKKSRRLAKTCGLRMHRVPHLSRVVFERCEFKVHSMHGSSYYRARYYDPGVGRFPSEDPNGFDGGRSFYSYVRNNPTLLIDPRGLSPDKKCDCAGNTGGWRAARRCCKDRGWQPSSINPNPYGPCDNFSYVNAGFMYRFAGDSPWGMTVRSCLLCAYKYGTSPGAAHVLCYGIASENPGTPGSPALGSSYIADGWGLGQAVGTAIVSGVFQTIQYFKNHGNRPFTCLDGVP